MFVIQIPFLNLDKIYNLGLTPRWIKFRDGKYAIPDGDMCLKVEQVKDRFIMNCTDEDFYNRWFTYFDVGTDYSNLFYKIRGICKDNVDYKAACNRANGIRVLQPDFFELTISAIMGFDPKKINELCRICGKIHKQSMRECGVVKWYEFPNANAILDNKKKLNDNVFKNPSQKREVITLCNVYISENIIMYPNGKSKGAIVNILGYHDMSVMPLKSTSRTFIKIAGAKDYDNFLNNVHEHEDYRDCLSLLTLYLRYNKLNKPKEVEEYWE